MVRKFYRGSKWEYEFKETKKCYKNSVKEKYIHVYFKTEEGDIKSCLYLAYMEYTAM